MAEEQAVASVDTQHDTKQQVNTPTPANKPAKNPKGVAASKATTEKSSGVGRAKHRQK